MLCKSVMVIERIYDDPHCVKFTEKLENHRLAYRVSMTCKTCHDWLGLTRTHDECPVRASAWCSQCGCNGHRPSECTHEMMWTRPGTLEELIPADVRERWRINTQTRIEWNPPTIEDAQCEIADINTIEIRYRDKLDAKIREFMKANKIHTTHKMDDNIRVLFKWATSKGKKIRLVQERSP